jgi:hypothetical protein
MTDDNSLQVVAKNPTDGLSKSAAQEAFLVNEEADACDGQGMKPNSDFTQKLTTIIGERNRLVRSVIQQPTDVLRDIAILAIGWAMHELQIMERRHQGPHDILSWVYGFRIIGLADGEYGHGMMVRATDDGPQMFDTSTCSLVSQLRKYAENGAG